MAEAVTIKLPDIGDVLLERSYRAKHINISVKPPSKVRVAVPVGVEFAKAQRIAEQRIDWTKKQQSRAGVKLTIKNMLDELPQAYSKDIYEQKCDSVYNFVYEMDLKQ